MWIVRNTLRGTLTFRGLGISLDPEGELDLDDALGRQGAEGSHQVLVAFEEGYLETLAKDRGDTAPALPPAGVTSQELESALSSRLEDFKSSLSGELQALRASLAGDVKEMLSGLKVAKLKLNEEKRRVLVDDSLSAAEIRARLAFLEEQERELTKHFQKIGRRAEVGADDVEEKADLLSSM